MMKTRDGKAGNANKAIKWPRSEHRTITELKD